MQIALESAPRTGCETCKEPVFLVSFFFFSTKSGSVLLALQKRCFSALPGVQFLKTTLILDGSHNFEMFYCQTSDNDGYLKCIIIFFPFDYSLYLNEASLHLSLMAC